MSDQQTNHQGQHVNATQSLKRRGLLAAAATAVAAIVAKLATVPVEAAYNLQGDTSNTANATTNIGPFTILTNAPVLQVSNGFTTGFTATADAIQAAAVTNNAAGVRGLHFDAGDGLYGHAPNGNGVHGVSSSLGVRGTIPSSSSAATIAVYGENNSPVTGGAPGAGGFGCYGFSAKGHGLVGATGTPGGGAVVGSTNGVPGAFAGIFYGPFIVVSGAKSAAVPVADGTHRLLYCEEAAESWFSDYGEAELTNGTADVRIDPEFALVADLTRYHVFLTPLGDFHIHISDRFPDRFVVNQTTGTGDPGACGTFSWRIVAKRKDLPMPRLAKITLPPEPRRPRPNRHDES